MRTDGRGQRALLPFKGSVSETVFCDLYTQWLCPSPHDKLNTITNNVSFLYSHHLCHPARIEVNLDLFALTSYVSTHTSLIHFLSISVNISSLCLSKVKLAVCLQILARDLGSLQTLCLTTRQNHRMQLYT